MTFLRASLLAFCFVFAASAQTPPTPTPQTSGPTSIFTVYDGGPLRKGEFTFATPPRTTEEKLSSALMGREMPYKVIVPADYQTNPTKRYPVIYLLHGLFGHYDNWTSKTSIESDTLNRGVIIVTPEGGDGWYTDSVALPNHKYESYIIKELIPEIDKKFRTIADRDHRAVAGLSMGGYGAIKFGLKYPEMFVVVGSFSGAIGLATVTEKEIPGAIGKSIDTIFGPAGTDLRKSNDPFSIIRSATPEKIKTFPFIYLDCGTEDFLFQNNRDFLALLTEKKVPHEFRELPGTHDWNYWNKQVKQFLQITDGYFGAK
jgi:putative tributyrin esterase